MKVLPTYFQRKFNINVATVFLIFNNFDLNEENIEEIYSFKDLDVQYFDLVPLPKLHKMKIDLSKIPAKI